MEDEEDPRSRYGPRYRPPETCGRCTHWHALTLHGISDKDAIIGALRCEGRTAVAQRICANIGVCGFMVERAETTGEPQQWHLCQWSDEPTQWCDYIDRAEVGE